MPAITDSQERLDRLRLIRSENVGPITFRELLRRFGSATAALDRLPMLSRRGGRRRAFRLCPPSEAAREIEAHERIGARLLVVGDADYPGALAAVEDAPPVLSARGVTDLPARPAIAIVGARNASANGRRFTRAIAAELGAAGFVVVSGLARGIDASAHQGALASGTIAVVAGGVDVVYPPEHADLQAQIARQGLVLAEAPLGTAPQARHFPSRNRIIAALSAGVLVVEAARRSGSLITAHRAADQGREVMAVPGSPLDPRCRGSNGLLRDGAHLVETAEDVIAALGNRIARTPVAPGLADGFDPAATGAGEGVGDAETAEAASEDAGRRLLEMLGPDPVPVDELARECHFSIAVTHIALLEAELAGMIRRHPGNQVSRIYRQAGSVAGPD